MDAENLLSMGVIRWGWFDGVTIGVDAIRRLGNRNAPLLVMRRRSEAQCVRCAWIGAGGRGGGVEV